VFFFADEEDFDALSEKGREILKDELKRSE